MMDEHVEKQIREFRETAQSFGDAALEAAQRGDIGWARTAARQAAQYARVVLQLETAERLDEPPENRTDSTRMDV
jgi:hypothetical protein